MTFAIIGSGAIGHAIATQFARKGMVALLANSRGPSSLAAIVSELGPSIVPATVQDALNADVVILAVPYDAIREIVSSNVKWNSRIVVDASNAIDFPAFKPRDLGGRLSSEIVSEAVPSARVVKAFNTIPAAILASDPAQGGGRRVIFLSGNDSDANTEVAKLINLLGFSAINLGQLTQGRPQQFGGPLVGVNLIKIG